jgi:hypothetical protein
MMQYKLRLNTNGDNFSDAARILPERWDELVAACNAAYGSSEVTGEAINKALETAKSLKEALVISYLIGVTHGAGLSMKALDEYMKVEVK